MMGWGLRIGEVSVNESHTCFEAQDPETVHCQLNQELGVVLFCLQPTPSVHPSLRSLPLAILQDFGQIVQRFRLCGHHQRI